MEKDNAIEVKHIRKSFRVYYDKGNTMKDIAVTKFRHKYEERDVIKDISFSVKRGEAIGLIGHNGCGKSTTLKLLSKIMYPDAGSIEMRGRVSSLIELGAGFHPDLSGRENIYINAAIFGLPKKEIDARLNDIIRFSELEEFIDNPVRTYSSGMYMRLAFSVAINVDADILLIDEILAVGDVSFQAKCFNRLREIKAEGTTIIIVSHSLSQVEQICDRSIWIHDGYVREEGKPRVVDFHYLGFMSDQSNERHAVEEAQKEEVQSKETESEEEQSGESQEGEQKKDEKRWGSGEVRMKSITVLDSDGKEKAEFSNDEPVSVCIDYEMKKEIDDIVIGVAVYRDDGMYIYGTNTLMDYSDSMKLEGDGTVKMNFGRMPLNSGTYTLDFAFHKPDGFAYDFWREACTIVIKNKLNEAGVISIPHDWSIE